MDLRIRRFPARRTDRLAHFGASRPIASIVLLGALACIPTTTEGAVATHEASLATPAQRIGAGQPVQDVHLRTSDADAPTMPVALETEISLNCVLQWVAYRACVLSGGGGDCVEPQCTPVSGSPEALLAQAILDARLAQPGTVN